MEVAQRKLEKMEAMNPGADNTKELWRITGTAAQGLNLVPLHQVEDSERYGLRIVYHDRHNNHRHVE
jgi:hypothetical protein